MNSQTTLCRRLAVLAGVLLAFGAQAFDNNLEKTFPVSPGGKLVLEAEQGGCVVKTGESDQVQVRVLRQVKNGTQAQADQLFANHQVAFQQDGNKVSVTAKNKRNISSFWRNNPPYLEVNFEITVPKKFDLDLRTAGGDIRVGDLDGKVKAHTASGTIALKHISGNVEAEDAGGDILIEEAGGSLAAHTTSGAIRVQTVHGEANLSDAGGDIEVGEADGALVAKTSSGAIRLKQVKGDLEASNAGGDIAIEQAQGDVDATTTSGSIHIGQAWGKRVKASNAGGDIAIREASGSVRVSTTSGSIKLKTIKGGVIAHNAGGDVLIEEAGDTLKAETTSGSIRIGTAKGAVEAGNAGGDVTIGEAGGKVVAHSSSGSIHIRLARGKVEARNFGGDIQLGEAHGPVQVSTTSGNLDVSLVAPPSEDCRLEVAGGSLRLALPKSAALNLDARSSGGEVKSELPITLTVQGSPVPGVLQGKLNGGGPTLYLRSSSGDIQLKASKAVVAPVEAEEPVK